MSSTRAQYKAPSIGTKEFAKMIDHTLLKLDATKEQIDKLCEEARKHDFKVDLSHPIRLHGVRLLSCLQFFSFHLSDLESKAISLSEKSVVFAESFLCSRYV